MQDPAGFLLVVEGGAIDSAHHNHQIERALEETVELEEAVRAVLDAVDTEEETLVIVTADHSHTLSINGPVPGNGHSVRGNDITGAATDKERRRRFELNLSATTLLTLRITIT